MTLTLDGAAAKGYKELVTHFVSNTQHLMVQAGFDYGTSGIVPDWTSMKGKRVQPIMLHFPSLITARGFYFQYKDLEWESDNGTQTLVVRLKHDKLDKEVLDPAVRLAVSTSALVTPALMSQIGHQIAV